MQRHYAASGLPTDGGRTAKEWTVLEFGPFSVRLSNFEWRRRALPCHDLHHVITGYPCTPAGELQIAAWEFAAGKFPNLLSTLFCLPLIGAGAVAMPVRSFSAFVRGRRSRTLYGMSAAALAALSVRELRERVLPRTAVAATAWDLVRYLALATSSVALMALPSFVLLALFLNYR
jgi:hypothetical protein